MKRVLAVFLMLMMLIPAAHAEDPKLPHVIEIAHRIDRLAENEDFLIAYDYSYADEEVYERVSGGDHTHPARIFHVGSDVLIDALYAGVDASQRPDFTRPELLRNLISPIADMLWGVRESSELSLLTLFARYKVFACEGQTGGGVYILLYEEATPVLVTWYAQEGAVCASAVFMPDEALQACTDAQSVSAWFAACGMPLVEFEEVQQ